MGVAISKATKSNSSYMAFDSSPRFKDLAPGELVPGNETSRMESEAAVWAPERDHMADPRLLLG